MMHATKTYSRTPNFRTPNFRTSRPLRSAANLGLGLLSLLSLSAGHAAAGTVHWDGTVADWFSNPVHWVGGNYPGAGDDAVNSSTAAMTLGQSTTVNSFFSNGAFTLQGGTFTGNQASSLSTLTVNNVFTVDGGTINNFTVNQGTGGSLVFTGSGGNFVTNSIINSSIDLSTNANAFVRFFGADTVNGAITLGTTTNGLFINAGGESLTLGSGGSLTGFGTVSQEAGGASLVNNGTVNANVSGQTLNQINSNFVNSGTAEATSGATLNLNNNIINSGALDATGTGSIVSISGTLTSSAGNLITASGGGQVQVNGVNLLGTVNESSGTALVFNGAGNNFVNNNGTGATINGNLDLATNTNAFVRFFGADTVNGAISLGTTSNGLFINAGGESLTLGSGGSLTGFGTVSQEAGGASLINNGTVNANNSGQTLNQINSNFVNSGTAEATNGGILSLNNSIANSGLLAANSGGTLDISGTLNSNTGNSINGVGGTVNIQSANLLGTVNGVGATTLVFNGSGSNFVNNNGTGATINANLDLATNANAFVRFFGADTVNGAITLGTTTNGLFINAGGESLTLGSGGSLTGFGTVSQEAGGASLINNGTVNANNSGQTLNQINSNFVNNGTAEATDNGVLSLNNNFVNNGALNAVGTNSTVELTGTYTGSADSLITASGGGQVQVNGVNLLGTVNEASGTALVFNGAGNNFVNNNGTGVTINGGLDLATNTNAFVRFFGADTVNGAISLGTTSNGIFINAGGESLTLGSGGSLTGFGTVSQEAGGASLVNNGTVNATGGTLAIDTDNFTNTGTTEVQNGAALNIAGNTTTTDSGNILVKTGGTATFGNPNLTQTAGLTHVDGTLNASPTLTGGTLAGTGTVAGNVTNTGGTVSAGSSASPFGTLTVNGSFTQGTGGALDANFSSTQNNLLAVAGAVTTGGALDVNYLGSGPYTGTGPFTFLDYTTLATSIAGGGPVQYFTNEMFLADGTNVIDGSNGFTYTLLDTTPNELQLQVLNNGAPIPAVPEASTTISLGALLLLGGAGLWRAKRRTVAAAD